MARPRILDLFCGAGLVHDGLSAAGFDVVGVDNRPQRRYPGPFLLHDALTLDERFLDDFVAIWASPPCLKDTVLHSSARREQGAHGRDLTIHPDLITPTQKMLDRWAVRTGGAFVIENVENSRLLRNPTILCGSMFDLGVEDRGHRFHLERHRKIETNWPLTPPGACAHQKPVISIHGGHARNRSAKLGGRTGREHWSRPQPEIMAEAMGLRRSDPPFVLTGQEIGQGIPPAYAEYVGARLIEYLTSRGRQVA